LHNDKICSVKLEQAILEAVLTLPPDKAAEVYEHAPGSARKISTRRPFKSVSRALGRPRRIAFRRRDRRESARDVAGLSAKRSVMPGVVDTHAIVWYLAGDGHPSEEIRGYFTRCKKVLYASWEPIQNQ
jgi:hypothetical protein